MSFYEMLKTASTRNSNTVDSDELWKHAESMYELGANVFINDLKKTAEEVSGKSSEDSDSETEEERKERRKKEILEKLKNDPEYRKKVEESK